MSDLVPYASPEPHRAPGAPPRKAKRAKRKPPAQSAFDFEATEKPKRARAKKPKRKTPAALVCLPPRELAALRRAAASSALASTRKPRRKKKTAPHAPCGCDAPGPRRAGKTTRAAPSAPKRKTAAKRAVPKATRTKARMIAPHRAARASCGKCGLYHSISAHYSHKYGPRKGRGRR